MDSDVYARGEKEVATTGHLDDVDKTRFVYGQSVVGAIPSINSSLVEVDDGNLDMWALQRNDSTGRATCEKKWAKVSKAVRMVEAERQTDVTGTDCNRRSERLQKEEDVYELQQIFFTSTGAIE